MNRLLLLLLVLTAACAPQPSAPQTITVMTHDSFAVSEGVVKAFEEANNAKVVFLQSGDAGLTLNKAILSKDTPLADVLFGVDNTFLSRALEADIFEPYDSPALADIPEAFKLDETERALPVDYGDVCINYDKAYFAEKDLPVPASLEDLTKPEYGGLLVVENPATSSPGLAFMLATRAHFGDGWLDYWLALRHNALAVADDWEGAYYINFSGSSGHGLQPMVVSYATSPVAEVIYADPPVDEAPTASIIGPDTCFRQIEFVGILKGTKQRSLAEKFMDFMLSKQFQEDVPLQMFVFPVNPQAQLPEAFIKYADVVEHPAALSPAEIAAHRDQWLSEWTETVLR
ncbi:MAG: ABC transporter substrate-binding protein [Chloroflexi bacterium RBG_16_56_8]|nr:MAG: ABC transporter substrate-binding protein [Chloroflexi bacterium RBG_16_56_8]